MVLSRHAGHSSECNVPQAGYFQRSSTGRPEEEENGRGAEESGRRGGEEAGGSWLYKRN